MYEKNHTNINGYDVFVVGLGFVGLTLAAKLCDIGIKVNGVEISDTIRFQLSEGHPHFHEIGLKEVLEKVTQERTLKVEKKLEHYDRDLGQKRVIILTIGTPVTRSDQQSTNIIESFVTENKYFFEDDDILMLRSTVTVGTCDRLINIFSSLGKKVGVAFCPERTIEGNALNELGTLPQIISGSCEFTKNICRELFETITEVITVSSMRDAEMAKLICNVQRDLQFAFANEVLEMCQALNCNFNEVRKAANYKYERSHLKGYGPVAGPCLEKDAYILSEGLGPLEQNRYLFQLARSKNEQFKDLIKIKLATTEYKTSSVIGVCGLAFKGIPETDDLRGSYVFELINTILADDKSVLLYDRIVNTSHIKENYFINDDVFVCEKESDFILKSDFLILHNDSKQLDLIKLKKALPDRKSNIPWLSLVPWERVYSVKQLEALRNISKLKIESF